MLADRLYNFEQTNSCFSHENFVKIETMQPDEHQNGGKELTISYLYSDSIFGEMLIASSGKGICYLGFSENRESILTELKKLFSNATYQEKTDEFIESAINFFNAPTNTLNPITLHIKATDFQLKVWKVLLKIPKGRLTTYGCIAKQIKNPKAARAVGSAVGANPVSYIIPCHRVIPASGSIGNYHWGTARKKAMIKSELL